MHNPILALYSAEAGAETESREFCAYEDTWELNNELMQDPGCEETRRMLNAAHVERSHYTHWATFAMRGYAPTPF